MHARVNTLQMDPQRIDDATRQLEEEDIPKFREIDGFRGLTLLADRASGKVIATTYWDSEEQMRNSEDAVKEARKRAAETGGASADPQVEQFEVAVDTFER
jgi:heme-degrading monooxygenase HmoA